MRHSLLIAAVAAMCALGLQDQARAQSNTDKTSDAAKATGTAAKQTGKAATETGKAVGKTTASGAKVAGEATKDASKTTANATKDASKTAASTTKDAGKATKDTTKKVTGALTGSGTVKVTCADGTTQSGKTKEAACSAHGGVKTS